MPSVFIFRFHVRNFYFSFLVFLGLQAVLRFLLCSILTTTKPKMDLFGAYDSWSIDWSNFAARDLGGSFTSRPICGSGRRHWNGQHARKDGVFVYTLLLSMGGLMAMSKGRACAHHDDDGFTLPIL